MSGDGFCCLCRFLVVVGNHFALHRHGNNHSHSSCAGVFSIEEDGTCLEKDYKDGCYRPLSFGEVGV